MSKLLTLAPDLSLPLDAVTQTFLVVGKRGSGKSNTAARFVEQLHRAGLPFVVLDPVDTWWGLKAGRGGERGLDVYVFGGAHADLPLEASAGALIADVLCEHRMPMVLSVKHFSGRERSTFMVDFARTLFQKWAGGPLHLVLEEAHEFAPQSVQTAREGEQAMLGAFKRLWKLGRASGIGGTAVTQRPASLSKDITTQSEILIAHRTIGPQDVKAIGEWVKYHGERLDMLADLPTLPTGQAFVWAPEFPEAKPIGLRRVTIALRETFDSASTPKVGERRVEPKELAAVDLDRLRTNMAATLERAKADDPRELRRRIAELERDVRQAKATPAPVTERVEVLVPAIADDVLARLRQFAAVDFVLLRQQVEAAAGQILAGVDRVVQYQRATAARQQMPHNGEMGARRPGGLGLVSHPTPAKASPLTTGGSGRIHRSAVVKGEAGGRRAEPEQRILDALGWWEAAGVTQPTRHQVAFVARYSVNGHFNNLLGTLRSRGLVDYPAGNCVGLTDAGRAVAASPASHPTQEDLIGRVLTVLRQEPQRRLFQALVDADAPVSRDDLAARCGYSVNGHFNNILGSLRALGVVDYPRGNHAALSPLFRDLG